jgi:hypothetical protein
MSNRGSQRDVGNTLSITRSPDFPISPISVIRVHQWSGFLSSVAYLPLRFKDFCFFNFGDFWQFWHSWQIFPIRSSAFISGKILLSSLRDLGDCVGSQFQNGTR